MQRACTDFFLDFFPAEAYERFTARVLRMDESVDSYAADLKKLLGQLSRVQSWCRSVKLPDEVCAASVVVKVCGPVSRAQIQIVQQTDDQIQKVIADLREDRDVGDEVFSRYQSQLVVHDGLLCHSYLDSVDGTIIVPVLPQAFQEDVVRCSHINTGHASWETMWRALSRQLFFPGMASACQAHIYQCGRCQAASPRSPEALPSVRNDFPVQPWDIVQIDTLELGQARQYPYHCVLVVVDMFSKWAEAVPLKQGRTQHSSKVANEPPARNQAAFFFFFFFCAFSHRGLVSHKIESKASEFDRRSFAKLELRKSRS